MIGARDHSLIELDAKPLPSWPARLVGRRPVASLAGRDRALSEQITVGVVKHLLFLQHLLVHHSGRTLRQIDPLVQKILCIGLYQLCFLKRIPAHAAVSQAVDQARRFGRARAAGFVNAVLRKAAREPDPPLPDPATDPASYAALALSHPPELYQLAQTTLGKRRALSFCVHNNGEPPTIVRLLPGARVEDLSAEGIAVQPHSQPLMYVVEGAKRSLLADWSLRGIAQAQDPTSAAVVEHLDLAGGMTVLDRCCGMGTKTMQMAERVGPSGRVIAMDLAAERCDRLRELLAARNIANVQVFCASRVGQLPRAAPHLFDRVLVDAPCGNSGVLARRPEARYAQTGSRLRSLAQVQDQILDDTAPCVAPGGRLVYATCSIWPAENEDRVQNFLSRHQGWQLLDQRLVAPNSEGGPTHYHDGGYWAALGRADVAPSTVQTASLPDTP